MMNGMRRAGQTWIGRVVVAILFSFLILSFAVWGIADMIRNVGQVNVARVGSTDITALAYRDTYQTELQNLSRRARRAITNDEARLLGLEQQVLNKMIDGSSARPAGSRAMGWPSRTTRSSRPSRATPASRARTASSTATFSTS